MFQRSARIYDAIYSFKDYPKEAAQLHALIEQYRRSDGNDLLDVACGTGAHIPYLWQYYHIEGLDLDEKMLAVARERFSDVEFHCADMVDFDLDREFDVVTCLFSSIGYVKTMPRLRQAIETMVHHLKPGGVLIVEPWFGPENFHTGGIHARIVDEPELKIARMNLSQVEENVSILNFHYLVGTSEGIEYFTERHELGLFSYEQYLDVFLCAGLEVIYDAEGLMNRGLFIGCRGE